MLVLFPVMAGAQEQLVFTLEDCIRYAMENNFNRQSLRLAEEASQVTFQQARDERLPSVNASLSQNLNNSNAVGSSINGNFSVNASLPVYQGGAITNTIEQNRLQMEQAAYRTSQFENELTIQILQAFLSVLGNEELLKFQTYVAEASLEQLNRGREQHRLGSILESDYLLFQAQYANDLNNIVDTEIARNNSMLALKNLLSMNPSTELKIVFPDTSAIAAISFLPAQEEVVERALMYMPDMQISQYNVDIAGVGVQLARAGFYPTVSVGAGIGTGHSDFSNFGTQLNNRLNEHIGVTVNVPIFNRNRTKANVARSQISLRQAELSQMQTELNIRQTVTQEYQDVVSAHNRYKVTEIRQNAHLKSFEAFRTQFNAGAITPVELLQQQNNYISALNDYIQSKYRFMLKRKVLDVFMDEPIKF